MLLAQGALRTCSEHLLLFVETKDIKEARPMTSRTHSSAAEVSSDQQLWTRRINSMSRTNSPRETTLLHLAVVANNLFVEIDTRDWYEYRKAIGCHLDRKGVLSTLVADSRSKNKLHSVTIAKTTGPLRSKDSECP
jgi:hypothetical protein